MLEKKKKQARPLTRNSNLRCGPKSAFFIGVSFLFLEPSHDTRILFSKKSIFFSFLKRGRRNRRVVAVHAVQIRRTDWVRSRRKERKTRQADVLDCLFSWGYWYHWRDSMGDAGGVGWVTGVRVRPSAWLIQLFGRPPVLFCS